MNNQGIAQRDVAVVWHPCTQMKDHEQIPLIPIRQAHGVYLEDYENHRYIDAISSWWVNLFGHTHPYINAKIKEQLERLEHVILAGFTHEPIVRLSERLVELAPTGLSHCFYADNGSSAIEVALKMSYHAHKNQGQERSLFLSLEGSYHGETLGALAVGDVALYKQTYEPLLIRAMTTMAPRDQRVEAADEALEALEALLVEHGGEISAMIVEPLLQGAGGMRMYHPHYLSGAKRACERYGIHFIADEILVGFGRTGSMFACEQASVTPDMLILSKGLTGGYLPLAVVMVGEEMYQNFYCDYDPVRSFLHSHSYTGNPLACAAANATLDIFESHDVIVRNREKIGWIGEYLAPFIDHPRVKEVRQCGMVGVIELYPSVPRVGVKIAQVAREHGVLIRPLGEVIYVMPPYIITHEELGQVFEAIRLALCALDEA